MLNRKLITLLNEQLNKELYSAYLYLDFANVYETKGLSGFANWHKIQAREEQDHGMIIYRYLHDNNAQVKLTAIEAPDVKRAYMDDSELINADVLQNLLKAALKHEEYISSLVDNIYSVAQELKDYKTMLFLDWFVKEQAEEEGNFHNLIVKTQLYVTDMNGLYMLDKELAGRVYGQS
ncbi:MAG: ferritin [Spirochaetota bacterium]|jgi:ferritin|nr:ferritin [Spirochaetota bacterium]